MCHCYRPKSFLDFFVHVESLFVHKLPKSASVEQDLDLAENGLDGVELGAVAHIVYRGYIQFSIVWLYVFCLVDFQLIHEQSKVSLAHDLPK